MKRQIAKPGFSRKQTADRGEQSFRKAVDQTTEPQNNEVAGEARAKPALRNASRSPGGKQETGSSDDEKVQRFTNLQIRIARMRDDQIDTETIDKILELLPEEEKWVDPNKGRKATKARSK